MLGQASVIAFVPVSDLAVAEKFYGGTLGLQVATNDGFALVLTAASGVMIRCVLTPDATPRPFTILGWEVDDVAAAAAALLQAGIKPLIYPHFNQDAAGVWTAPNGDTVAWFKDPDGNVLSLSHHPSLNHPGSAKK